MNKINIKKFWKDRGLGIRNHWGKTFIN